MRSTDLPTFGHCAQKLDRREQLTALERFIHDNEPAVDDKKFREQVAAAINEAAGHDVKPYDRGPGTLEVGLSNDLSEVVVNHPCLALDPRGGHLVFLPQEARDFAQLLMLKADQAEGGKA